MGRDRPIVPISAADLRVALELAEPEPDEGSKEFTTSLDFMVKEPSGLGKVFRSGGVELSVAVEPLVDGGPHYWYTDVRFPRRFDVHAEFARVGLEWPVWWAVSEVTHLVDKTGLKQLSFSGFGAAEYALPWFVRLHAAIAGIDPSTTVFVRRSVERVGEAGDYRRVDSFWEFMYELNESIRKENTDERLKQLALEEWYEREAEWKRSTGRA